MDFLNENIWISIRIFIQFIIKGPINNSSISSDSGLVPTRRQAIIWTNDDYFTDTFMHHSASMRGPQGSYNNENLMLSLWGLFYWRIRTGFKIWKSQHIRRFMCEVITDAYQNVTSQHLKYMDSKLQDIMIHRCYSLSIPLYSPLNAGRLHELKLTYCQSALHRHPKF